jgi:lipoate-protein ligase A
MAADEVMLESAIAGTASLRFYRWSEPTLSLGYFQPAAVRTTDPRLALLPCVRRATGGATLVHHHELTYALALPAGPPWQRRGDSWLLRMHGILVGALAKLGVAVSLVAEGQGRKAGEVLCFLHQTPGDVLLGGHKVVGSAQRKRQGALLQHGSVLLARSEHTPELPGLREIAGYVTADPTPLERAVTREFRAATGWRLEPAEWGPAEAVRSDELARARYLSDSWNAKR